MPSVAALPGRDHRRPLACSSDIAESHDVNSPMSTVSPKTWWYEPASIRLSDRMPRLKPLIPQNKARNPLHHKVPDSPAGCPHKKQNHRKPKEYGPPAAVPGSRLRLCCHQKAAGARNCTTQLAETLSLAPYPSLTNAAARSF